MIEERNHLKAELAKLQADRDLLFESKLGVEGSLQECLSQRQQLIVDCERNRNTSRHLQLVARSLQQQNEILNNRVSSHCSDKRRFFLVVIDLWYKAFN